MAEHDPTKDVQGAFCTHCFCAVVKDKMTEHWIAMHKNVKANEVRV